MTTSSVYFSIRAVLGDYVDKSEDEIFLKTIIPSRKATEEIRRDRS